MIVSALHGRWLYGLWRVQQLDNDISFFFRDRIMQAIGIDFPSKIHEQIEEVRRGNRPVWCHWSRSFQLGITVLLAVGAIAAVLWAANQPEHEKKQSAESDIELTVGQNKLHYKIPDAKNIKIILDKDGKLDFQTTPTATDNPAKP